MPDLTEMKPFWMVHGVGQRGPAYQHDTEAAALREAERLAENNPGTTLVVLEATQAVRSRRFDLRTAPRTAYSNPRHKDVGHEIPF